MDQNLKVYPSIYKNLIHKKRRRIWKNAQGRVSLHIKLNSRLKKNTAKNTQKGIQRCILWSGKGLVYVKIMNKSK